MGNPAKFVVLAGFTAHLPLIPWADVRCVSSVGISGKVRLAFCVCLRAWCTTIRSRLFPSCGAGVAVADLGIKAHAHMLRHACGYKLANDGHDTRAIQAYLGHRNIQNTTRYTALAPERFKEFFRDCSGAGRHQARKRKSPAGEDGAFFRNGRLQGPGGALSDQPS